MRRRTFLISVVAILAVVGAGCKQKASAAGIVQPFGSGAGPFPHGTQLDQFAYFVKWGKTPVQALQSAMTVALATAAADTPVRGSKM